MFKKIYKEIIDHNKIIIIRHKNPDFDAYGSQFGLYYALKNKFPKKEIYIAGDDNQNNFYHRPMDKLTPDDYKDALVIYVDQSCVEMLNDENFRFGDKLIIMDHHLFEPDFADIAVIRPEYSSASELITEFLYKMKIEIPKEAADALYIGIAGDSSRFLYKGTRSNTFDMASILLKSGADIIKDYALMSKDESVACKRIKGYVLSNFIVDGQISYAIITKEVRDKIGIDVFASTRGTAVYLANMENCEIWAVFAENDEHKWVVEVRSKQRSVVDVCKKYGGGGHTLACGTTVDSRDTIDNIINDLKEALK